MLYFAHPERRFKLQENTHGHQSRARSHRRSGQEAFELRQLGVNDQIGALNYVTPPDIVDATKLVRNGKAF